MADGHIRISIEVDGKEVNIASKELDKLEASGHKAGSGAKSAEDGLKGVNQESHKATGNIKKFVAAVGLVAIAAVAFNTLRSSMDAAISRFDTLNKFPKVLQALGVSAEDSERAMERLSDGIDGLPTKLDEIASTAQRMYTSFNDMDKATDSAIALNNALLGSGSSAADAARGTQQYIKFLQTGKMEMDSWNTLQETMDIGLIKIAESFGYAGKTAKQDLYEALKEGTITVDQFNDKLIEVGTGTGIMADLARENSLGIATSLGNLRNAAARGMADIIKSFDNLSKELTGKDIAQNIDSLKRIVNQSFKAIGRAIEASAPYVKAFASAVSSLIPIVKTLSPVLIGMASAYAMHAVIARTIAALKASKIVTASVTAVKKIYTLAVRQATTAEVSQAAASKLLMISQKALGAVTSAVAVAQGVLTGRMKLSTAAMLAKASAAKVMGAAMRFLSGPVGLVTVGIGAVAGAAVAVVKWFRRSSQEAKRLKQETEELANATDELIDSVEESVDAYKDNIQEVKTTGRANRDLVRRIDELSRKENKSAADKHMLKSYIDQLNESVEDLNLTYDEEADALSMTSEQMRARVDLLEHESNLIASRERMTEIAKEQMEVEMQLEEINKLRDEWNQKLEEGSVKSSEHSEEVEKLDKKEKELIETLDNLSSQYSETERQVNLSSEKMAEITESGVLRQKIAFEDLSDAQKATVDSMKSTWEDYKDAATEMFDTLSDESELTVAEMTANLEENQRIIGEWAEGIATLAERGVDQGLLDKLREAGPESAGHVKALVNASDEELARLSETFAKGGELATEALSKSLGIDESGLKETLGHLVIDAEKSLREQIQSADFRSLGIDVTDGLSQGISDGTKDVADKAKGLAHGAMEATKTAFGIKSPSREYKTIGGQLTEGLELGISGGTAKVIKVMKNLSKSAIGEFKNIYSDYKSIGQNAMEGLNQGLLAGQNRVLSTARSIANSVRNSMQSALRIQSPSKVMRDDVGRWIPEGIAEGIEKHAKSVYNALNMLTGNMIVATPEQALGTSRMVYTGQAPVANVTRSSTPTTKQTNQTVIKLEPGDVIMDGRKVGEIVWKPVKENIDRDTNIVKAFRG